jgi:hypothetical protein
VYAPFSPEFLFWQCREAALAAVEAWEILQGSLASWQSGRKIDLLQDAGVDLNAYYDRASLSFFHYTTGKKTTYSGASTDVVAHEAGHGFLDAIRPDFWTSNLFEVNAFHEAFGDVIAILTALLDDPTRITVLPQIAAANFVEATAEDLSDGIKRLQNNHNASVPRRARNPFQWQPPESLPMNGGPGALINEIHSFGQIFSGCFYDTVVNVFQATGGGSAALLAAAKTVGQLVVRAAAQAPQRPRFFREVGRAMMLLDQQLNGGANQDAVRRAFQGHNIALGSTIMLAPETTLPGSVATAAKPSVSPSTRRELRSRLGASPTAKMRISAVEIGPYQVTEAVHEREVSLSHLHKKLKGVVATAPETTLLGNAGGRAAVLGALPDPGATVSEVETLVKSLLAHGAIQLDGAAKAKSAAALAKKPPEPTGVTHAIKKVGGKKMLVRMRFACPRDGGRSHG